MARYSWINRTLDSWAREWWLVADQIESTNQLYRWMIEGINQPGNTYGSGMYPHIMDAWTRRVHMAISELPEDQSKVVIERYCVGPYFLRRYLDQWSKELDMPGYKFRRLLTKAHNQIETKVTPGGYKKSLRKRLMSSTLGT